MILVFSLDRQSRSLRDFATDRNNIFRCSPAEKLVLRLRPTDSISTEHSCR